MLLKQRGHWHHYSEFQSCCCHPDGVGASISPSQHGNTCFITFPVLITPTLFFIPKSFVFSKSSICFGLVALFCAVRARRTIMCRMWSIRHSSVDRCRTPNISLSLQVAKMLEALRGRKVLHLYQFMPLGFFGVVSTWSRTPGCSLECGLGVRLRAFCAHCSKSLHRTQLQTSV